MPIARAVFLAPLDVPAIADTCETVALPIHGSCRSRSRRQRSNKDNRGRSPSAKSVKSPCTGASPQQLISSGSPKPPSPSAKSVKSPCTGTSPQQLMSSGSPTPKSTAGNIGVRLVGAEAASLHTHAAALERKAARLQQRSDQMASPARPTVHELVNEWKRLKQRSDEMMVMHAAMGTWISSASSSAQSLRPRADARELAPTAVEVESESAEAEDADDEESAVQMHLTLTSPNACSAQDAEACERCMHGNACSAQEADDAEAVSRRQWQPPSCRHAVPSFARHDARRCTGAGEVERRAERHAERHAEHRDEPRHETKDERREERCAGHSQLLALQHQLIRRVDALEGRFCTALWTPPLAAASSAQAALADASPTGAMGMLAPSYSYGARGCVNEMPTPSYGPRASFGAGVESSLDLTPLPMTAPGVVPRTAPRSVESSLDLTPVAHGTVPMTASGVVPKTAPRTVAGRQERIRRACKLEGISSSQWISRAITLRFDLEAALLDAPIMAPVCTPPPHALEDLA